jgi:hypothetical protein
MFPSGAANPPSPVAIRSPWVDRQDSASVKNRDLVESNLRKTSPAFRFKNPSIYYGDG